MSLSSPRRNLCTTLLVCLAMAPLWARAEPRKDAAEAMQEGSVPNWLEYYRRERNLAPAEVKPAPAPEATTGKPAPSAPEKR